MKKPLWRAVISAFTEFLGNNCKHMCCVTNSKHPPAKNQTVSAYTALGIVMWS